MRRSLSEIRATAEKAARGAGLTLGHAEDFGRAVASICTHGAQGLSDLIGCLDGPFELHVSEGPPLSLQGSPVLTLPLAIDAIRARTECVFLEPTPRRGLALGYLASAKADFDISLQLVGNRLERGGIFAAKPALGPFDLPDDVWDMLESLAAKVFVPATDASREKGAGAGLDDND